MISQTIERQSVGFRGFRFNVTSTRDQQSQSGPTQFALFTLGLTVDAERRVRQGLQSLSRNGALAVSTDSIRPRGKSLARRFHLSKHLSEMFDNGLMLALVNLTQSLIGVVAYLVDAGTGQFLLGLDGLLQSISLLIQKPIQLPA